MIFMVIKPDNDMISQCKVPGRNQIRISKSEIRNKFKIPILQGPKQKPMAFIFGHLNLGPCFGFRASDFEFSSFQSIKKEYWVDHR